MNIKIYVTYHDKNYALIDLLYEKGLIRHQVTIQGRIKRGWSCNRAIETPINTGRRICLVSSDEEYYAKYEKKLRKRA